MDAPKIPGFKNFLEKSNELLDSVERLLIHDSSITSTGGPSSSGSDKPQGQQKTALHQPLRKSNAEENSGKWEEDQIYGFKNMLSSFKPPPLASLDDDDNDDGEEEEDDDMRLESGVVSGNNSSSSASDNEEEGCGAVGGIEDRDQLLASYRTKQQRFMEEKRWMAGTTMGTSGWNSGSSMMALSRMCQPSFSKLHFVRRFQPLWHEFNNFMESAELVPPQSVSAAVPLQFDMWRRFAQAADPKRRESAANALTKVALPKMDGEEEKDIGTGQRTTTLFELLQLLMQDENQDVVRAVCKQLPELALQLRQLHSQAQTNELLLMREDNGRHEEDSSAPTTACTAPNTVSAERQFQMRVPALLMAHLLAKEESGNGIRKTALVAIERLVDDELLAPNVVQNLVVPGLLLFLNEAAERLRRLERILERQKAQREAHQLLILPCMVNTIAGSPNSSHNSNGEEADEYMANNIDSSEELAKLERSCQQDTEGLVWGTFSILGAVLAQEAATISASSSNDTSSRNDGWARNGQLLERFLEYVAEPQKIPLLKSVQDSNPIRELLARSLAPLAKLMGRDGADAKLLPIFQRYMRDTPEVQCAALKQLADFCSILSQESRELLLPELSQLVTLDAETRSWRQRAEFAEQLTKMCALFPVPLVNTFLCPFALAFSADRISEVRNNGLAMLAMVLSAFVREEWTLPEMPLTEQLLSEIRVGFHGTRDWRRRQSFGRLVYLLLARGLVNEEQFCRLFQHDLLSISNDTIANVRQYFCLIAQLNQFPEKCLGRSVHNRLEQMAGTDGQRSGQGDSDLEIRNLANIALGAVDPERMSLDLAGRAERLAADSGADGKTAGTELPFSIV